MARIKRLGLGVATVLGVLLVAAMVLPYYGLGAATYAAGPTTNGNSGNMPTVCATAMQATHAFDVRFNGDLNHPPEGAVGMPVTKGEYDRALAIVKGLRADCAAALAAQSGGVGSSGSGTGSGSTVSSNTTSNESNNSSTTSTPATTSTVSTGNNIGGAAAPTLAPTTGGELGDLSGLIELGLASMGAGLSLLKLAVKR